MRLLAALACLLAGALAWSSLAAGHPMDVTDVDDDRVPNWADNCPQNSNPKQHDTDADTVPSPVDQPAPHPSVGPVRVHAYTPPQAEGYGLPTDRPADTGGDACDNDDDNDGITDLPRRDNCRLIPNPDQRDSDFDGVGDACDPTDNNALAATAPGLDPNDRRAPRVAVRARRVVRFDELGRGLAVPVRCDEGCRLDGRLLVAGRSVATGRAQLERAGSTFVFMSFRKQAMRKLTRKGRALATLRLIASDANGNRVTVQKRLTLRR